VRTGLVRTRSYYILCLKARCALDIAECHFVREFSNKPDNFFIV
jgi:hypothetical protein